MFTDNDFDKAVKRKLENFAMAPSPEVWSRIQSHISDIPARQQHNGKIAFLHSSFYQRAASAVLIVSVAVTAYFSNHSYSVKTAKTKDSSYVAIGSRNATDEKTLSSTGTIDTYSNKPVPTNYDMPQFISKQNIAPLEPQPEISAPLTPPIDVNMIEVESTNVKIENGIQPSTETEQLNNSTIEQTLPKQ